MLNVSKQFVSIALQKAVQQYLDLDPESKPRLQALAGKTVQLELRGVNLAIVLDFIRDTLQIQFGSVDHADTVITGTPLRLLHMTLADKTQRKQFFADDVVIVGDLDVGQQVIDLFDHLDIDWEEQLAQYVGDVPAHHVGRAVRQLFAWGQEVRDALSQNVSEYIHEEVNYFPPAEAARDFFRDVDTLRMDADRLEIRIKKLLRGET